MRLKPLLLILLIYTVAVISQSWIFPLMEGSDEILHLTYVEHLRQHATLPDRTTFESNCTQQESGQPPLTYALAALLLNLAGRPTVDCDLALQLYTDHHNPWLNSPDPWLRGDNVRAFLPFSDPLLPDLEANLRLLRGLSLLFALLAVTGAYAAANELFDQRRHVFLTTIVFAFTPQFSHLSSYFNNDISSIAFATLLIWRTLRLLRLGASRADLVWLGLLSGLAILCKVSTVLILPALALAFLFQARRHEPWQALLLRNLAIYGLVLLLVLGPWLSYGILNYGDPLGIATHTFSYETPRTLDAVLDDLPSIYLTYLGKFGYNKVLLRPVTYTAISLLVALALLGYARALLSGRPRPQRRDREKVIILLLMVLLFIVGYYRWFTTLLFVTARLMMPIHVIFALALVYGWKYLLPRSPLLSATAASVFMFSGAVLTPLAIYDAYAVPAQQDNIDALNLSGPQFSYDETIRFLGYEVQQERITERGLGIKLCWEVLKLPERRAAFSLKLVLDGEILADKTSIFGMGNYDSILWTLGHRFCDAVYVPVNDPDTPAAEEAPFRRDTVYDMLLVLLDADTFAVDWQATQADGMPVQYPFIGQLKTVP